MSKSVALQWISKQLCSVLSGPSSESSRTMHSLSSFHDSSVFKAEPGSAVVLCSTEQLVLGITGGSHSIVTRRCCPYDPTSASIRGSREGDYRGNTTSLGSHITSQSCAFLCLPLACQSPWSFSCRQIQDNSDINAT